MPFYVFENNAGRQVEEFRTVGRRDEAPAGFRRIVACRTGVVIEGRVLDPTCADAAVPRAFRELESQMPVSQIEKTTGYGRNEIKRIWNL